MVSKRLSYLSIIYKKLMLELAVNRFLWIKNSKVWEHQSVVRRNNRYKEVYNQALDLIDRVHGDGELPAEAVLSTELAASRTTIRTVLSNLQEQGLIAWQGRQKSILRKPRRRDYYVSEETHSTDQIIEQAFMEWILGGDLGAGTHLNESELARNFQVSISAVREFLIGFSRFGLIEKEPNRGWILKGFTKDFALELSDVREMFELRSLHIFLEQPREADCWQQLDQLERKHLDLSARVERDYLEFPRLDDAFHRLLNSVSGNRFVNDFHDVISLIFHYHFRWNKRDERERNMAALVEHLDILAALKAADAGKAERACKAHLASARKTLLRSIDWD